VRKKKLERNATSKSKREGRTRFKTWRADDSPEVIDLSTPLASLDTQVWPGVPLPVRSSFLEFADGGFHSNLWMFEEHTSTHVDAPFHIDPKGQSIDKIALSKFIGRGIVLDFAVRPPMFLIEEGDIRVALEKEALGELSGTIVLFRTGYTKKFGTASWLENPTLGESGCRLLLKLGVKGVGFDAASPDREPYPAHKILLPAGVALFENLANLEKIKGRAFTFIGVPIRLVGGTGSPTRAIALISK
jgi:kynurenine formamidase